MNLPDDIAAACKPLFNTLPLDQAMPHLVGSHPTHTELVNRITQNLADRPELIAGLWLYVDDLDRSHTVSQSVETKTGSYWHGIMHRREGDFSNSHYWHARAAGHPLLAERPDLDPDRLVDDVSKSSNDPALVQRQRSEWQALFEWCAAQSAK